MNRRLILGLVPLAAVGVAAAPSTAGPKRAPIKKTYTVTAPAPDPTNYAQQGYSVCAQNVPQSFHRETFSAPAAGSLKVEITDFLGDWDLLLLNDKGGEIASAIATDAGTPTVPDPDSMLYKVKKPQKLTIVACNWVGGPTAKVTYTFTFA